MPRTDLIPQEFWFRLAIDCPEMNVGKTQKQKPTAGTRAAAIQLPATSILPNFQALGGRESWFEVRAGWEPGGLALAFEIFGKTRPIQSDPYAIGGRDEIEIWIDTRDTREIHRASRFCRRFLVTFPESEKSGPLKADVAALKIARAQTDAPPLKPGLIDARAETTPDGDGYRLTLFFPAEALHGFDPETNRRLGFAYRIGDPERGDSFLTLGREFPIGEDPSLWATLCLVDESR